MAEPYPKERVRAIADKIFAAVRKALGRDDLTMPQRLIQQDLYILSQGYINLSEEFLALQKQLEEIKRDKSTSDDGSHAARQPDIALHTS